MRRALCALLLFCVFVGPMVAAAEDEKPLPPLVTWKGSTTRVLAATPVEIPMTFAGEHLPPARVRQVTRDGVELNPSAFTVSVEQRGTDALLVVRANANEAREAGAYKVSVMLTPSPVDAGTKVAKDPVHLDLTLTRAAAVKDRGKLQFISPLSVTRVVRVPFLWSVVEPDDLILAEGGGKAGVSFVPAEVDGDIRSKSTNNLGRLHATFPQLGASAQDKVKLKLDGTAPWVGDADARISVSAPTVSEKPIAYKIAVHSRLSYFWLFLMIVLGIVLGQYVKRGLEARGELLNAKLTAEHLRTRIVGYEAVIADLAIRDKLRRERERLLTVFTSRTMDKAAVEALAKDVEEKVKSIVASSETMRVAAGKQLDEIRAAVGRPQEQDGALRAIVRSTLDVLNAQKALLDLGQITQPLAELAKIQEELPARVRDAVTSWTPQLRYAQRRFGKWPGTQTDEILTELATKTDTVTVPHKFEEVGTTLGETAVLTNLLRTIGQYGIRELHDAVQRALAALRTRDDAAHHAKEIDALEKAAYGLHRDFDLPRELELAAQAVANARAAVDAAEKLAPPKPAAATKMSPESMDRMAFPMAANRAADETTFESFESAAPTPEEQLQHELAFVNTARDSFYGLLIVIAGVIIFRNAFIGTLEDLFGAFLWGFSVNLSATTLSQYAAPLMTRKPIR
ncbi:MAG: hypothetical protein M3Q69_07570 [Acidobacteriota bacterium]|nr:hypothetical protein [Acidobacteriota bacterium]